MIGAVWRKNPLDGNVAPAAGFVDDVDCGPGWRAVLLDVLVRFSVLETDAKWPNRVGWVAATPITPNRQNEQSH